VLHEPGRLVRVIQAFLDVVITLTFSVFFLIKKLNPYPYIFSEMLRQPNVFPDIFMALNLGTKVLLLRNAAGKLFFTIFSFKICLLGAQVHALNK